MTFSYKSYYNYVCLHVVMIYYELPIFIVCRMYIFIVFANNKGVIHDYFIFGITIDTLFLMLLRHFSQCQYKILLITQIFKCISSLYFNSMRSYLNRNRFRGIFRG